MANNCVQIHVQRNPISLFNVVSFDRTIPFNSERSATLCRAVSRELSSSRGVSFRRAVFGAKRTVSTREIDTGYAAPIEIEK